jgi:hypothetical protein
VLLRMSLSALDRSQVGWLVPPVQLNTSLLLDADSIVPVECEPKPIERRKAKINFT